MLSVNLDIAHCKLPIMNEKAIDTLVMPLERKDMIRALVQRFTTETSDKGRWAADFIENKGEGQIFLHGSPGVGKTFVSTYLLKFHGAVKVFQLLFRKLNNKCRLPVSWCLLLSLLCKIKY
jgi:hypothetical protein